MAAPGVPPSPAPGPAVASLGGGRPRRFALPVVGLLLLAIALDMAGVRLPLGPAGGPTTVVAGVAVRGTATLARFQSVMTPGAPPFLAVEPGGELAVVDRVGRALLRFAPDGRLLTAWGPRLSADVELQDISGVAVRPGQWFLVDRGTLRVLELDAAGRPRRGIGLDQYQTYGPNGLALDGGTLYLADTGRGRVLVIGADGQLLGSFGAASGDGQMKQPMGVAFAPDGALYVADWENARILRWLRDGSASESWRWAGGWSVPFQPFGVAVDHLGRVYAPDMQGGRVFVYAGDGTALAQLGLGAVPLPVDDPVQVAVGRDGTSLVVLGAAALGRLDLEDVAPPPRPAADPRLPWLGAALGVAAMGIALALWKRRRPARRRG